VNHIILLLERPKNLAMVLLNS